MLSYHPSISTNTLINSEISSKGGRSVRSKEILRGTLCDTMRKREFEILSQKLLDIRTPDVRALLNFNNFEDL